MSKLADTNSKHRTAAPAKIATDERVAATSTKETIGFNLSPVAVVAATAAVKCVCVCVGEERGV